MNFLILLPVLLSLIFGLSISFKKFKNDAQIANFAIFSTCIISLSVFLSLFLCYNTQITLVTISDTLNLSFKIDGLSVIFSLMVSVLWPIATFYAKTYMTHEGKFKRFFTYYTLTFGVVLGLAISKNMFTLYVFYELLTFITLPLVTHNGKPRDMYAGRLYILYMIFGASLSFIGMMIFIQNVGNLEFSLGGITQGVLNSQLLIAYILMFIGFAIKSGLFPFYKWLITAGVAPTTVTALLHAVAVVKSGAFATMRLTYYFYDYSSLSGTFAQTFIMSLVTLSVVFGSFMAIRSSHLKRRLAFSTVSQLSYILLGVSTMSIFGLKAAILHMIFHAFMKIVLFYGAGNIIFTNHAEYLQDIRGYGKIMKPTFITFTICGLALVGVPPLAGFFSKFALAQSCIYTGGINGFLGVCALITSAFFTSIYIFQILLNAFLPNKDFIINPHVKPAPKPMQISVYILAGITVCLSLGSMYVYNFIDFLIQGGV